MSIETILAPYLTSLWGRRAAFGAMGLAALLLLLSLINGISWVGSLFHTQKLDSTTAPVQFQSQALPDIASWHLFGVHIIQIKPKQMAMIPDTTLELSLHGLFKDSITQESKALISGPGQAAKLYGIGETVPGGAIVIDILGDSVVLQHNGQLEKLTLPIHRLEFGTLPEDMQFQSGPE